MNLLIDARRPLLAGVLDYRGGDASDGTTLEEAVSIYRNALLGPHGWIIGRFLCPTSRLEQLVALLTASMRPGERPWYVGAVFDQELGAAAMHASVFDKYMSPAGSITSVETMTGDESFVSAASLATATAGISPSATTFVDVGPAVGLSEVAGLADIALSRIQPVGALLDATAIASDPAQLAEVVRASTRLGIPLKIVSPFSPSAILGFLKLLAAAALTNKDASFDQVFAALTDDGPGAVTASAVGLRWQDELFGIPDVKRARATVQSWNCSNLDATTASFAKMGLLPL